MKDDKELEEKVISEKDFCLIGKKVAELEAHITQDLKVNSLTFLWGIWIIATESMHRTHKEYPHLKLLEMMEEISRKFYRISEKN